MELLQKQKSKIIWLLYYNQMNQKKWKKRQVELLMNKRVDGIIISLSNESNDDDHWKKNYFRQKHSSCFN